MFISLHVPHVLCHMSHAACKNVIFLLIFFSQSGGAIWQRVCYRRGLPRVVFRKMSQNVLGLIKKGQSRKLWFLPINHLWSVKLDVLFTALPGNLTELIEKQEYINILMSAIYSWGCRDSIIWKSPSVRKLFQSK